VVKAGAGNDENGKEVMMDGVAQAVRDRYGNHKRGRRMIDRRVL